MVRAISAEYFLITMSGGPDVAIAAAMDQISRRRRRRGVVRRCGALKPSRHHSRLYLCNTPSLAISSIPTYK
jgi:hypothetical protein